MYTYARTVFKGEKSESQIYSLLKVFLFFNKVMRSSKFDPCFTPPEEVGEQLKRLVVFEGCKLDGLLNKGEINQGAQLALSVLKTAKAKSVCGQGLSLITITQVSTFKFTKQFHFKEDFLLKLHPTRTPTLLNAYLSKLLGCGSGFNGYPFSETEKFALSSVFFCLLLLR